MALEKRQIIYGSVLCASAWVIYGLNFYSTLVHSDLKVWFTCAAAAVLAAALITGLIVAVKRGELKELAVTTGISAAVILNAVFWSILPILFVCAVDKLNAYLSIPTLFILAGVTAVCILALLAASAVRRLSGKGSGKTLFFIALAAEAVMIITLSVFFPRTVSI